MPLAPTIPIESSAPIPTWFRIGGRADRLLNVRREADLRAGLELDPNSRILGDGANLLVDDAGVGELVLATKSYGGVSFPEPGRVIAEAGADLARLINETVRRGLGGLEGLAGIPATIGGAAIMNAGGAFGQIADVIARVHAFTRDGTPATLERRDIPFEYRRSGLSHLVISRVELSLTPDDPAKLRQKQKDVMAYKKQSQPLAADSAGCCFKNPTLTAALRDPAGDIGAAGQRVSAGLLIDRAGLKGLRCRGASVSMLHANFLVPDAGGAARDVIELMTMVEQRVFDRFGVRLEREVVVWTRNPGR